MVDVVYKVKDINFESNSQPKGASGIYTKSFSHFTDSYKYQFGVTPQSAHLWNGVDLAKNDGYMFVERLENEFIVNRGYEYRVYKIEYGIGRGNVRIYVDLLTQKKRKVK